MDRSEIFEINREAQAVHQLALSNFDNIWPWRLLEWWRVHREVNQRLRLVEARLHAWKLEWE